MKNYRTLVLITVLTITSFCAVLYSSCKKDACSGVTCQNQGTCSGGKCTCPTGYSGDHCEMSSITYTNHTYTPIYFTYAGQSQIIDTGKSITITGSVGTVAKPVAYTSLTDSSGVAMGNVITWNMTDSFPDGAGALNKSLTVQAGMVFIQMVNNTASDTIRGMHVNDADTTYPVNFVLIPNNGHTYGMGYYTCTPPLYLLARNYYSTMSWNWSYTHIGDIPYVTNAMITVTAH